MCVCRGEYVICVCVEDIMVFFVLFLQNFCNFLIQMNFLTKQKETHKLRK